MPAAKVMIVDDDEVVRTLINLLLRAHGYETCFAGDAYHAVASARTERPDAVILDFGLPGGDALVVIERLRRVASFGAVPIIVVSARDAALHADRALAAGAVSFIQKPFQPKDLIDALEQALLHPARIPAERRRDVFHLAAE